MQVIPLPHGLYIHSPFCVHKCGYCDFNSWAEGDAVKRRQQMEAWLESLERQCQFWGEEWADRQMSTVFWGGGTPSYLDNDILLRASAALKKYFKMLPSAEWTFECNPETLNHEKLKVLGDCGANRLSVGIQSFDDLYLTRLERHARRKDNLEVLERIATHWQGRWSLDLMFGLPGQSLEHWLGELDTALEFSPEHISAYQLTLTTARSKSWDQAGEEDLLFFFNLTEERLHEAGLLRYEVSNFAKPGQECQHNLGYWRLHSFLGLGPGAAGLLTHTKFGPFGAHQKNPDHFDKWCAGAGQKAAELKQLEIRSLKDHFFELFMMGLRLNEGIECHRFGPLLKPIEDILKDIQALGLIEKNASHWRATGRGLRVLDSVLPLIFRPLEELFVDLSPSGSLDLAHFDPIFKDKHDRESRP